MIAELLPKLAGMEKEERGAYYPRPSLAGIERCIRQMVYWSMGIPVDREIGDRYILTIDDSKWHEELTADWLRKSAYQLHSEQMSVNVPIVDFVKVDDVWIPSWHCNICNKDIPVNTLHGHIDGILTDMLLNDFHYEHKAINRFAFERYWKGEFPMDYITQAGGVYNRGLRADIPKLRKTVLLVKCKDTARYMEFIIAYDYDSDTATVEEMTLSDGRQKKNRDGTPLLELKNIVGNAVEKFYQVYQQTQNKTLPDRPFEIGTDFPCGYCGYENTCWKGYEKEYKELSENIEIQGDIENICKYYLETGMHISEMEKEKDVLKAKIKEILKKHHARQGKAGIYTISNQLRETSKLNTELIPGDILKKATKKGFAEFLTIRRPKKEEV